MNLKREDVRVFLAKNVFSPVSGFTFDDWISLLAQQRFRVSPAYWPRAAFITLSSLSNSLLRRKENRRYGEQIRDVTIAPPVFILGHWRSGTTHLHNLITIDPQFAYANFYQATQPHTFLSTEAGAKQSTLLKALSPKTRMIDNMSASLDAPMEDEVALCILTRLSPILGNVFPARMAHYDKYLTFREVGADEVERWKAGFLLFIKKLTLKYQCPIVLKSPTHTCRIRLLLELFPDARFIHIHRNPYVVFQSYKRSIEIMNQMMQLQRPRADDQEARIIEQYRRLHDGFFEEKDLIPRGQFFELAYEALEQDPMGQLEQIYQALGFDGFESVAPRFQEYLASLKGYRKSELPPLDPALREQILKHWGRCFDEWGYER